MGDEDIEHESALDAEMSADLHAALVAEYAVETEPWALERVARVMERLNAARPAEPPLIAHILHAQELTAFTVSGINVYITRRLLERLASDESTAFVLAHEIAHHDCGHLALFRGGLRHLPRGVLGTVVATLLLRATHRLHGPEREADADLYGLALCMQAGFDPERCLHALQIMEMGYLDRGDIDGVFGPENLLDPTDPRQGSRAYALQRWLWTRSRRYLPVRERRDRLQNWLQEYREALSGEK